MSESMYPQATREMAERRRALAPEAEAAFRQFGQAVFKSRSSAERCMTGAAAQPLQKAAQP
jgi:hypothetical protein